LKQPKRVLFLQFLYLYFDAWGLVDVTI